MTINLPRRTLLTTGTMGAALGAAALLPGAAALAAPTKGRPATSPVVDLNAEVLDSGEQVVSLTLRSKDLNSIEPTSLTTGTFTVHVRAFSPLDGSLAFEQDRTITAARWKGKDVVLDLEHGWEVPGGTTLLYTRGRNVQLDLEYTVTQVTPLRHRGNQAPVTFASFTQGELLSPEVDAFSYHQVENGLKYRQFAPSGHGKGGKDKKALVVWLHGGGEGALLSGGLDYYDNESTLRANRGALGFVTKEAQKIFGGAYVVAPQATSAWMQDGDGFAPMIQAVIDEVVDRERIDVDRIHVLGCSNGGFMSLKMTADYPEQFASQVPICSAVSGPQGSSYVSDDALRAMSSIPTWLVAAANDTTINPQQNTVRFHELIEGSIMSLYPTVEWEGDEYPGHWSWVYVARNDPQEQGVHIWEWMASQSR